MIKTFFVDGDKGGVGKSTVARFLVDTFINAESNGIKKPSGLIVIDADPSNADVCGDGGHLNDVVDGLPITAKQFSIRESNDWIEVINMIEEEVSVSEDEQDVVIVFSLPAAAGLVILENPEIAALMDYLNGTQVWVLGNEESSVQALERRYKGLPSLYSSGIVVRNLKHGHADTFRAWNTSELKKDLLNEEQGNNWVEVDFPVMQQAVMRDVGRTPIYKAINERMGADNKVLKIGTHISLRTFRGIAGNNLAKAIAKQYE